MCTLNTLAGLCGHAKVTSTASCCSFGVPAPFPLDSPLTRRGMANLSAQLEEMRAKAVARLSATGSSTEVKADIVAMADIPLPLSAKYRHIAAEAMVEGNGARESHHEVRPKSQGQQGGVTFALLPAKLTKYKH